MSKILFSEDQVDDLRMNPYVKNVAQKSITYTDEFKELAVKAHCEGKSSRQIFIAAGFRIDVIGSERAKSSLNRWEKMSHRDVGYTDMRHTNSKGRARSKPRSPEEEVAYLKDKLEYLEQENEFLKKLRAAERQAMWASQLKSNTKSSIK
jgi:hydrogenase maturation factor